jgi:hypothetical protein
MTLTSGDYQWLTMPAGSVCFVNGSVTIEQGVSLGQDSALAVQAGSLTANGPVTVGPDALFADFSGTPAPIHVNGPVSVGQDAVLAIYFSTDGTTQSSIAGPVRATEASVIQIIDTYVGGPVSIQGGGAPNPILVAQGLWPLPNLLWDSVVVGPVSEIGYAGTYTSIAGDITGPMTFTNNSASEGSFVGYDIINGPLTVANNTPPPSTDPGTTTVTGPIRGNQAWVFA